MVTRVRVLIFTWRDAGHPEAGGSETYVERVCDVLVELGHEITIFTAGYDGASRSEQRAGRTYLRRGGRYSVYVMAAAHLFAARGRYDVVLDVQNGVPFWTPLWTRIPTVNLVHHVHREQWPEVFGPVSSRIGWWLESRAAPKVYSGRDYVTVSDATRQELVPLGIRAEQISVVHGGNDLPDKDGDAAIGKSAYPSMVVLGRLVPHKRVELALEAVALHRAAHPELRLTIVGHGYWEADLKSRARDLGVSDAVRFTGFVSEDVKHSLLAESWLQLLPSVKEGWGLVVLEAGLHGTPTVAFRAAGGTTESVLDLATGLLADNDTDFLNHVGLLLADQELREELGRAARDHAHKFSWQDTAKGIEKVLDLARLAGVNGSSDSRSAVTSSRT